MQPTDLYASTEGTTTDAVLVQFVIWDQVGRSPVVPAQVVAWITGFCSNESVGVAANPHLAGLCNFTQSVDEQSTLGGSDVSNTFTSIISTQPGDVSIFGTTPEIQVALYTGLWLICLPGIYVLLRGVT